MKMHGYENWVENRTVVEKQDSCVQMKPDGKWDNTLCHSHIRFICESKKEVVPATEPGATVTFYHGDTSSKLIELEIEIQYSTHFSWEIMTTSYSQNFKFSQKGFPSLQVIGFVERDSGARL